MSDLESDAVRLNDANRGSHGGSSSSIESKVQQDRFDSGHQEEVRRIRETGNERVDRSQLDAQQIYKFTDCTQIQIGDTYNITESPPSSHDGSVSSEKLLLNGLKIKIVVKLKLWLWLIITVLVILLFIIVSPRLISAYLNDGKGIEPLSYNNSSAEPTDKLTTSNTNTETTEPVITISSKKNVSEKIPATIKRVFVTHTTGAYCKEDCSKRVEILKKKHLNSNDFPYKYLIGGDGVVYSGSLIRSEQASILTGSSYNFIGVNVAFIGTYSDREPSKLQLQTFDNLIKQLVREDKIDKDYKIFIPDQFKKMKKTAHALNDVIRDMYREKIYDGTERKITNITNDRNVVLIAVRRVYGRDFWEAKRSCREVGKLIAPISHVVFTEAGGFDCTDIVS